MLQLSVQRDLLRFAQVFSQMIHVAVPLRIYNVSILNLTTNVLILYDPELHTMHCSETAIFQLKILLNHRSRPIQSHLFSSISFFFFSSLFLPQNFP